MIAFSEPLLERHGESRYSSTSKWWMHDNTDLHEERESVIKRPNSKNMPNLAACLSNQLECGGFLEKLSHSDIWPQWQLRYWELRGGFLLYFKSSSSTEPLGALNLRHFSCASLAGSRLILVSVSKHEFHFRAASAAGFRPRDPSIADWQRCITNILKMENVIKRKSIELDKSDLIEKARVAMNVLSLDEQVEKGEGGVKFGDSASSSACINRVSLRETQLSTGTYEQVNDDTKYNEDEENAEEFCFENMENDSSNEPAQLPLNFRRALYFAGISMFHGQDARLMWIIRIFIFIVLTYNTSRRLLLSNAFVGSKDTFTPPPARCTSSLFSNDGEIPCLFVAADYLQSLVCGPASIIIYIWLIRHANDPEKMLHTHRRRMSEEVDKYGRFCLVVQGAVCLLFTLSDALGNVYSPHVNRSTINTGFVCGTNGFILSAAMLPFTILSLIYHAETIRLNLVLKDFISLMHRRHQDYSLLAPVYLEMVSEWSDSQERLGPIASLMAATYLLSLASNILITFYFRLAYNTDHLYSPVTVWLYPIINIALVLPLSLLNVNSMISANKGASSIRGECTKLIANSMRTCDNQSWLSNRNAGHAHENFSMLSGLEMGMNQKLASPRLVDGFCAIQLATVVERSPCELRLLGRKVTWSDVSSAISVIIVAQMVNVLGLGKLHL